MSIADDQLQASVSLGYDSNPFKLSSLSQNAQTTESANVEGAAYTAFRLKYQGDNKTPKSSKKGNFRYRVELQNNLYSGSKSAADSLSIKAHLSWIEGFKLGQRKGNIRVTTDLRRERNTYYSQTQRQIAETSSGDLIDDRFSFDGADVGAELTYYRDKKLSWSLLSKIGQRNYPHDYRDIGLESIDYREFRLQPGLRYRANSGLNTRLFLYQKFRHYSGLSNNPEKDSALVEYSLMGYGMVLNKALSKNSDASLYLNGYFARDNGEGIRDLNYHQLSFKFNYQLGMGADFTVNAKAYQRAYLKAQSSPEESETGAAGPSRAGEHVEFVYSRPLLSESLKVSVSLRAEYERNTINLLGYQRQLMAVSLLYKL